MNADVSSVEALSALAAKTKDAFGTIDVIFANAGVGLFGPIDAIIVENFHSQFDVNVRGVFFTVQKLVPLLNDGGSIILNASAVNAKGVATGSVYFATKAAVRSFARSFAAELGPTGIRVNCVSPGIVRTEFDSKLDLPQGAFEDIIDMFVKGTPLGREGTNLDVANAVVYLGSNESSYISGTDLSVDGGRMHV